MKVRRCRGFASPAIALLRRVLRLRKRQLLRMDDLLVDGVARRTERRELAVRAVALHHIAVRHRLAADLVGDGALDDRPVDPARAALLLDVLEAPIDHRVERIELALDPLRAVAATVPAV